MDPVSLRSAPRNSPREASTGCLEEITDPTFYVCCVSCDSHSHCNAIGRSRTKVIADTSGHHEQPKFCSGSPTNLFTFKFTTLSCRGQSQSPCFLLSWLKKNVSCSEHFLLCLCKYCPHCHIRVNVSLKRTRETTPNPTTDNAFWTTPC